MTPGAGDGDFDSLFHACVLGSGNCSQTIILCLLARFATLWLVLQAFVMKKYLLADCPGKFFVAINACYRPILKVRRVFDLNLGCAMV